MTTRSVNEIERTTNTNNSTGEERYNPWSMKAICAQVCNKKTGNTRGKKKRRQNNKEKGNVGRTKKVFSYLHITIFSKRNVEKQKCCGRMWSSAQDFAPYVLVLRPHVQNHKYSCRIEFPGAGRRSRPVSWNFSSGGSLPSTGERSSSAVRSNRLHHVYHKGVARQGAVIHSGQVQRVTSNARYGKNNYKKVHQRLEWTLTFNQRVVCCQ